MILVGLHFQQRVAASLWKGSFDSDTRRGGRCGRQSSTSVEGFIIKERFLTMGR